MQNLRKSDKNSACNRCSSIARFPNFKVHAGIPASDNFKISTNEKAGSWYSPRISRMSADFELSHWPDVKCKLYQPSLIIFAHHTLLASLLLTTIYVSIWFNFTFIMPTRAKTAEERRATQTAKQVRYRARKRDKEAALEASNDNPLPTVRVNNPFFFRHIAKNSSLFPESRR